MPDLKNAMVPQELLVVGAALKTGIFDLLNSKPQSIEKICSKLSMDQRSLWVVLEALISLGYIEKKETLYALTKDASDIFYNENSEKYVGYSIIHTFNVIKSWSQLPEVLKTGKPAKRDKDQMDIKGFMYAMKRSAKQVAAELVNVCLKDLPLGSRVIDLGGGPLNYARPFARAGARVTVQDIPEVCTVMSSEILPEENITFVPGDFTTGVAEGPFDLAFLGNITHIYGEKENVKLFERTHQSLATGGRIAILDMVRGISPRADLFGVNMLVNTETGGTWTLEQYTKWLTQAGFTDVQLHILQDRQIIMATKG